MKSTGVTRKIDELGRIVIPKEIRKNLGIRDGESLEIFIEQDNILLKKYSEVQSYEELSKKLCEIISDIYNVSMVVTDREKVIAASTKQKIKNKKIDERIINLIDNRSSYISNELTNINFEDEKLEGYFTIMPIISSIDSLGTIIVVDKNKESYENLTKLLAKIIVDNINI